MHSSRMRTARVLIISQHALHRGVSAWRGVSDQGVSAQGVSVQGVSAQGVSAQGGVCPVGGGRMSAQWGVKTLPWRNSVAGGKYSLLEAKQSVEKSLAIDFQSNCSLEKEKHIKRFIFTLLLKVIVKIVRNAKRSIDLFLLMMAIFFGLQTCLYFYE